MKKRILTNKYSLSKDVKQWRKKNGYKVYTVNVFALRPKWFLGILK